MRLIQDDEVLINGDLFANFHEIIQINNEISVNWKSANAFLSMSGSRLRTYYPNYSFVTNRDDNCENLYFEIVDDDKEIIGENNFYVSKIWPKSCWTYANPIPTRFYKSNAIIIKNSNPEYYLIRKSTKIFKDSLKLLKTENYS